MKKLHALATLLPRRIPAILLPALLVLGACAVEEKAADDSKIRIGAYFPMTGPYAAGFLHTGLWARSRHPNYFAEQGIWIAFYFFSVAASGQWINWSVSGCLLLVILFRGSSSFSEEISAGKYPEYLRYQQAVPRFIPIGGSFRQQSLQ